MDDLLSGRNRTALSVYSAQLLDHFQNPRNAGELPDADATVEIENPVCGDVIRLSLKLDAGRIEIKFKAKGCVPAMACGSALTQMVLGKTAEDARMLTREDLVSALFRMPSVPSHAAQLALDALSAALARKHNLARLRATGSDSTDRWCFGQEGWVVSSTVAQC